MTVRDRSPIPLSKVVEEQQRVNRYEALRDNEDPNEHEKLYRVAALGIFDGLQKFDISSSYTLGTTEVDNAPESLLAQLRGREYVTGMTVNYHDKQYVVARLLITEETVPKVYTLIDILEHGQVIPDHFKLESIELVPKELIDLES